MAAKQNEPMHCCQDWQSCCHCSVMRIFYGKWLVIFFIVQTLVERLLQIFLQYTGYTLLLLAACHWLMGTHVEYVKCFLFFLLLRRNRDGIGNALCSLTCDLPECTTHHLCYFTASSLAVTTVTLLYCKWITQYLLTALLCSRCCGRIPPHCTLHIDAR